MKPERKIMRSNLLSIVLGLTTFSLVTSAHSQSFVNLDFEDTTLPPPANRNQAEFVPFTNAFPGWTGYIASTPTNQAAYNGVSLGAALVALISTQTGTFSQSNNVINGNFTAVLCSGGNSLFVSAALAQSGLIPIGTQSLMFDLGANSSLDGLSVTFDDQNLSLIPFYAGPNYETYIANISAYAGMTGELRFTESPTSFPFNFAYLDDIQFSPSPVPEPSMFSLSVAGALLFVIQRQKKLHVKRCRRA
jgi:hypothetical protein